jgi:hypothetical protein
VRPTERGDEMSLEVSDDGCGLQGVAVDGPGHAPAATVSATAGGSGLRGMSERLVSVGGRLSVGHAKALGHGERGLRITATVPVPLPDAPAPSAAGPRPGGSAAVSPGDRVAPPTARVPARPE